MLAPADRWVYNKNLQILQISTLREYLRAEFRVCEAVPFRYDFERVVDDFVFMCLNCFLYILGSNEAESERHVAKWKEVRQFRAELKQTSRS